MSKIVPQLWYVDGAEEAARFYVSLFADSRIDSISTMPAETPAGPPGSVKIVEFTLRGQPFVAFSAGGSHSFNHAVSFVADCEDQAEVDRLWAALGEGGTIEQCGWLRDRWGLCWQIIPKIFFRFMKEGSPEQRRRVTEAMLRMVKFDIEGLQRAYDGATAA